MHEHISLRQKFSAKSPLPLTPDPEARKHLPVTKATSVGQLSPARQDRAESLPRSYVDLVLMSIGGGGGRDRREWLVDADGMEGKDRKIELLHGLQRRMR